MDSFPNRPACLRCGLSVHRILSDAIHTKTKYPKLGRLVAQGVLINECGKTKQTGQPSHITWWVYPGIEREKFFATISEED